MKEIPCFRRHRVKEVTYALRSAPAQNMRPAPVKIATLQETKNTVSASPCTCMYDNTETQSHGGQSRRAARCRCRKKANQQINKLQRDDTRSQESIKKRLKPSSSSSQGRSLLDFSVSRNGHRSDETDEPASPATGCRLPSPAVT